MTPPVNTRASRLTLSLSSPSNPQILFFSENARAIQKFKLQTHSAHSFYRTKSSPIEARFGGVLFLILGAILTIFDDSSLFFLLIFFQVLCKLWLGVYT